MKDRVIIFDTTLRDGEQCPGASMNNAEKLEVARQLARLNVDVIEAGFPISSPGDFEAVREIATQVRGPIIAALARITEKDVERAGEALKPAARGRIHTFTSASDIHLESILRLTRDQNREKAVKAVKHARAIVGDVEFSAQDVARADRQYLVDLYTAVAEAGASTLNIPDTVGYSIPEEFGELIGFLVSKVKVKGVVFSVHCHNDLGLAVANSLAAVQAGARQVECTVNGIGERAGNCSLEEVVMALKVRKSLFKVETGIKTREITRSSRLVSTITGMVVQPNKAIVGANAFAHESGIHQDGVFKNRQTYEIMEPSDIGLAENIIKLGRRSGRHALKKRLEFLGVKQDDKELDRVYEAFVQLADRKKDIYDDDLLTLIEGRDPQAGKDAYALKSLKVSAGTEVPARCAIEIGHKGKTLKAETEGTGPVDALYKAIDSLIKKKDTTLVSYSIQAITGGTDAQGDVTVILEHKGRRVSARAAHTDVIVASALAYLSALNRMNTLKKGQPPQKGI
ncbi:MAG: 2-isopropylmalate synthase [candidate division FCPU426 bacterium]